MLLLFCRFTNFLQRVQLLYICMMYIISINNIVYSTIIVYNHYMGVSDI